jgi:hypothetical protein
VPLFVEQVDVIDRYTGAQAIKVLLPYRTIGLSVAPVHAGSPEFQYYASLYREALRTLAGVAFTVVLQSYMILLGAVIERPGGAARIDACVGEAFYTHHQTHVLIRDCGRRTRTGILVPGNAAGMRR